MAEMSTTGKQRDAELVELLSAGRSVAEAAAALGCSVSTVYRRFRDASFRSQLRAAKAALWAPDTERLRQSVGHAIATIENLMTNAQHESTRLRAAVELIRLALDTKKLTDLEQELDLVKDLLAYNGESADAE
jgi:AcrR family transcriptional regulator